MIVSLFISVLPGLLNAYWTLAAGAALVALLPIPETESFRQVLLIAYWQRLTLRLFASGPSSHRAAVMLTACRGKLWQTRPTARLGALTVWR